MRRHHVNAPLAPDEKALLQEAQTLRAAQSLARLRSWMADLRSDTIEPGPGDDQIFRHASGSISLTRLMETVHPDDKEAVQAAWSSIRAKTTADLTYRVLEDGELRWLHATTQMLDDSEGQPRYLLGIAQDITEQKEAAELISAQRDLARVIGAVADQEAWPICLGVALRLAGMDSGGIYLYDADQCALNLVYHQGLSATFVRASATYTNNTPNMAIIRGGSAAYFSTEDLRRLGLLLPQSEGLRAIAVIPVHHQGQVVGCINLASHTLSHVPALARRALEAIAPEIGSVVVYRHTAAALRESRQRLELTINGANVGTWDWDVPGGRVVFNQRWAAILGYTLEELEPGSIAIWEGLCHPEDLERSNMLLERHFAGESAYYECEVRMRHKQGHWVWVLDRGQVIERDASGKPLRMSGTHLDITARKTAEEELRELNQTLEERVRQRTAEVQGLYDHAPIGYHSLDAQGTLIRANQTFLSWLGYTREELIGRPITDLLTPAGVAAFQEAYPHFVRSGQMRDLEFDMLRKDGSVIPVLIGATAVYDEQGAYLMSRTMVFDNTERRWAETALRESEAQTRLLFEESPDAMVLLDGLGQVVQLNRAFELLTGYDAAQITGRSLDQLGLISWAQSAQLTAGATRRSQAQEAPTAVELHLRPADGETRAIAARVFGLHLQGRRHYLATMRDITTEKWAEETLRRANQELAQAARAKDEFLANMSHELRTPLNAILAFSEGLIEQVRGPLNQRQIDALRSIESSGRHLLTLINDILDLSKVEAGRLDIHYEPVALAEVCEASLLFVKELAAKKSLKLSSRIDCEEEIIYADPKRLKQMLVNLLSNAVKFTAVGGYVRLEVTTDPGAGLLRFVVEDNGIGIKAEDMAWLFQPFKQLDSSLSRHHEGTGLGLALVRRLAHLHGGEVAVTSEPGYGSRFTITLPTRPAGEAQPDPMQLTPPDRQRPTPAPEHTRILMAEDNEINIMATGDYLQAKGYTVFVARDGREALTLAEAVDPDAILMDIQMPELDGLEVTRRLRAQVRYADTPIIALTALAMPGDRERCLTAGANAYFTKPVSLRALLETIEQLLRRSKVQSA